MSRKFYVVWEGRQIGVYDNWDDVRPLVENFPGARYKSYSSQAEAVGMFRRYLAGNEASLSDILMKASDAGRDSSPNSSIQGLYPAEVDPDGWAVDASCLGNPGVMEYRGVELSTGKELFRVGPFQDATNNIGEFLAIIHALALMYQRGERHSIYSDSKTGMSWVKNRRVRTMLEHTGRNDRVFELLSRGLTWLQTHEFRAPILKWQTDLWGEIPADFGRK